MNYPIYFCKVTVTQFTTRGKRRIIGKQKVFSMPMLVKSAAELMEDSYTYHAIARKFIPKGNRWELIELFKKQYFIKDISLIKIVGETNNASQDFEWI